ncbi:hypothetical protein CYLTODRAFT_264704 [Cylindrobasidium torrendii FP15055 ss-10]|uniref:Uncharacterized protein n=1 Tax=Cylindrobasidium torrendii FP15055 ss-10 TaxID=1314674 RepID=A0A0D7ASS5_9AGAR|nr:hypothetical protein CYLTODRAFT_264704 [Cylindrobasidium torrendii FP15055 ss-10]
MAGSSWSTSKLWELVALITTPRNFKVLYGKQEAGENTIGDTKAAVHRRIAAELEPDLFQQNTKKAIDRVKRKITDLESKFKEHVQRLKKTGEGVDEYYTISKDGPDHDTDKRAVNIWEQIKKEFPFFPELWKYWSTRPNFVPICVTTGLTPHGPTTTFLQPLRHDEVPSQAPAPPTRPPTPIIDPAFIQPSHVRHLPAATALIPPAMLHHRSLLLRPAVALAHRLSHPHPWLRPQSAVWRTRSSALPRISLPSTSAAPTRSLRSLRPVRIRSTWLSSARFSWMSIALVSGLWRSIVRR